jgi:hypothetical protein
MARHEQHCSIYRNETTQNLGMLCSNVSTTLLLLFSGSAFLKPRRRVRYWRKFPCRKIGSGFSS